MTRGIYQFNPEDAYRFAREQGIRTRQTGSELVLSVCPYCRQTTKDKNTFAINLENGAFNCKRSSCGAKGNMLTLAKDFDFSLGRNVDEYYSQKRRFKDLSRYPRPDTRPNAVKYMEGRGISREVTERYSITTRKDNDSILVFPFYDEQKTLLFIKYRQTDKNNKGSKEWSEPDTKPILFGIDQCNTDNKTLILTEGQIDSLSVTEAGIENAVSVPTGCNGFTWVPYCWDFLGYFDTLIVFGDYEHGNITLLDEMRKRFPGTVKHVRPEDYGDCKDANEILQKYGKQKIRECIENAVPALNPRIRKLSEVQRKNMSEVERIATGFPSLDRVLGGLYYGQLVILTGERGLGKSTFGSQLIVKAVEQRVPCFCYSGELPEWFFQDWFDRQCAGSWHTNGVVRENGFTDWLVDANHIEAIHSWYDDYCWIYDNGIAGEDENQSLLETIDLAIRQNGCRMLLIDNLMTAIADDVKTDLWRQQTEFVRKLAEMTKRYDVLIILVVHPRKTITKEFRNDDVAGSSAITNFADVVLRYAKPDGDGQDPNGRILQITKNRFGGRLEENGIQMLFDAGSKRITEDGVFNRPLGWEAGTDSFSDVPDDMDLVF